MTEYCDVGDTPKVYFQFNGQPEEIYESKVSPVDVTSEDISSGSSNYNPLGYLFSAQSTNTGVGFSRVFRDFTVIDQGAGLSIETRYALNVILCDGTVINGYTNVDPSSIVLNSAVNCGDNKPATKKTTIHVKSPNATTDIFTATGDYPGTYKVACTGCPEGYCQCASNNYPGYCCQDCAELAQEIAEMVALARTKHS